MQPLLPEPAFDEYSVTLAVLDLHCETNVFPEMCKLVEPTSNWSTRLPCIPEAPHSNCKPTVMSAAFPTGAVGLHVFPQFLRAPSATSRGNSRVDPDPVLNRRSVRERGFFRPEPPLIPRWKPADNLFTQLTVEFLLS